MLISLTEVVFIFEVIFIIESMHMPVLVEILTLHVISLCAFMYSLAKCYLRGGLKKTFAKCPTWCHAVGPTF